ncbi:MAG: hypothetical protein JHC57_17770 [Sphingopyxis sp.]|uniref:hypothetical protein n=1 Tax=Sphingopyxis sp. TaxID=1908224 RepID=UPI001A2460CE|nr:hypothetical protein [Sphingopyxis sp.]MBJ7501610.1 hypothetical protein [Sphingopyxis sp.]
MFDNIRQLRDYHAQIGPLKFWSLMAGVLAYCVGGATLMQMASWPGQCDHEGRRLTGYVKQLGCSLDLLSGGPVEYMLFVFLWSMPATVAGALIYAFVKKHRRNRNPILPLGSVE